MLSLEEPEILLDIKRAQIRADHCSQPVGANRGVLGTSQGISIDQEKELDMVKKTKAEVLQKSKTAEEQRKEELF